MTVTSQERVFNVACSISACASTRPATERGKTMAKQAVHPRAVILTALPVEYDAVRQHLRACVEETYKGTTYERGVFSPRSGQWDIAIVQAGVGNTSAATQTERAIERFKPDVALFVGVAGGVKDVVPGDVVAATEVFSYASGNAARTFLPRSTCFSSTSRMKQNAQAVERTRGWLRRIPGATPEPEPGVRVAPIAAGEQVISSTRSATYRFLRKQYSQVVAVEMEGFGFLQAVQANPSIEALVVRGISDLLDHKAETEATASQEYASRHASAFAFEVLARLTTDPGFMAQVAAAHAPQGKAHAPQHVEKKGGSSSASKYAVNNKGPAVIGDYAQMTMYGNRSSED